MSRRDLRANPPAFKVWGLYNWGNLWDVFRTRREAIAYAEKVDGRPWAEIKSHMEIHKVTVTKESSNGTA